MEPSTFAGLSRSQMFQVLHDHVAASNHTVAETAAALSTLAASAKGGIDNVGILLQYASASLAAEQADREERLDKERASRATAAVTVKTRLRRGAGIKKMGRIKTAKKAPVSSSSSLVYSSPSAVTQFQSSPVRSRPSAPTDNIWQPIEGERLIGPAYKYPSNHPSRHRDPTDYEENSAKVDRRMERLRKSHGPSSSRKG